MEQLKDECGVAMIRLLKPLDYYQQKYGTWMYGINYKHAKGGYVEHVPDSLTKVFYTAGGRKVRDGGVEV